MAQTAWFDDRAFEGDDDLRDSVLLTSLSLSILATRGGHGGRGSLLDTTQTIPASAPAKQGETRQITVTPSVDGQKGVPQNVSAPVVDPNSIKQQVKQRQGR